MDPTTFVLEALFAIIFMLAVRTWWERRDVLSRDVVLVFSAMGALFALQLLAPVVGPATPVLRAIAVVLLLGQPTFTLRLAAGIHPVPRPVFIGAMLGWLLTTVPLVALRSPTPVGLVLAAVAVFVVSEAAAAAFLAAAARRRAGAGAVRLWLAAAATALFAFAFLALGAGSAGGVAAQVASGVARGAALLAALAYLVAFVPPAVLRRGWQASTAYRGLRELLALAGAAPADIWRGFLDIAQTTTAARGALVVVAGSSAGERRVAVATGIDIAADDLRVAPAWADHRDGEAALDELGAMGRDPVLDAARTLGAGFAQWVRLGPSADSPTLILLSTHRTLFAEEDRNLLAALGQQAAGLVGHRAALATQERLALELGQTVEALRAASQAKSDFLASMSHELRTPLNAIIGFSDLMRREEADADGNILVPREWVAHIQRGGSHLVELVNDVLDLSKVEAGRLDLDREPLELLPAVAESVAGLRPLADRKGHTVELAIEPGLWISADRGRLRQIVYNLLSNAVKFTPDSGHIRIEGTRVRDEVHLSVIDSGVGIAPEDQAAVFEEFRQVGRAAQRSEGTGLGLALTRRLVEAHDGRMELDSTPGVGSRFTAVLPAAEQDRSAGAPAPAAPPDASADMVQPRRVLVVEDDPSAVRLLREYLEPEGFLVQVAADGETALAMAREAAPTAILLDVLLPGIDGWEVLRRLKADPRLRHVPVVIVTVVDERDVGLALGAVDYLVKPIDRDALLACLGRLSLTSVVRTRPVRILTVDDDPAALDALEETLRPAGFDVLRAGGGPAGVELARAHRPDLVICDLVMPELDGFGVVGALKSDPATAAIPIIILTGHDLSAADKRRLNGKVLGIVWKGPDAQKGLLAWLVRAGAPA